MLIVELFNNTLPVPGSLVAVHLDCWHTDKQTAVLIRLDYLIVLYFSIMLSFVIFVTFVYHRNLCASIPWRKRRGAEPILLRVRSRSAFLNRIADDVG